jgi:hypothetical protein
MSAPLMELVRQVGALGDNPSHFRLKEALRRWGTRDTSRGGGPLNADDRRILNEIIEDPTVEEALTQAKEACPSASFESLLAVVIQNGKDDYGIAVLSPDCVIN